MVKEEMIVNPYDVSGVVDYNRLIKEFGIKPINEKLLKRVEKIAGEVHPFLKRGIFFAHRDLEKFLDDYEKGKKVFLYTGCGPSGPIHIGHYVIWSFSTIKSSFGFTDSNNIGSIFYTAMQTVPTFLPNVLQGEKQRCLIPLGVDQDPHFRISRDIVEKLGHNKPSIMHAKMLPALTGIEDKGGSSSSEKIITMVDTDKQVKTKINKHAFSGGKETVEEHRKEGGDVSVDIACQWLVFFEEDDTRLQETHNKYAKGELLSGEVKAMIIEKIQSVLEEHQKRREKASSQIEKFLYKN
jgi:tryptophanyl-tRNA synthetase